MYDGPEFFHPGDAHAVIWAQEAPGIRLNMGSPHAPRCMLSDAGLQIGDEALETDRAAGPSHDDRARMLVDERHPRFLLGWLGRESGHAERWRGARWV